MRRVVLAAVSFALLFPATTASSSGDTIARKALKLAKSADAKATKALARKPVAGPQGDRGVDGLNGRSGQDGRDGVDGVRGADGARGAVGQKGDKGDVGETGAEGPAGTANLNASSTTNAAMVSVDLLPTVVVSLDLQRDNPGSAFVTFDGQMNGENANPDGVLCELRVDAATVAERFLSVPGNGRVIVSESALVTLDAGQHTAAVSCRRASSLSNVQFPASRSRLTVLAG